MGSEMCIRDRPKDVPFLRCLLKLQHESGRTHSPDWFAGHAMKFDYLLPGTWKVWVETRDGDFLLGGVEGIVVREGEETSDTRLLPLDLSRSARPLTFRFTRPDGQPYRREQLQIGFTAIGAARMQGIEVRTNDKGEATVLIPVTFSAGVVLNEARVSANFTIPPGGDPVHITF